MLHSMVVVVPREPNDNWSDFQGRLQSTINAHEAGGEALVNLTTLAPQTGQQSAVVALTFVTQVKT